MHRSLLTGCLSLQSVSISDIDRSVLRILTVMFRIGTMDAEPGAFNVSLGRVLANVVTNASLATAKKVATASSHTQSDPCVQPLDVCILTRLPVPVITCTGGACAPEERRQSAPVACQG